MKTDNDLREGRVNDTAKVVAPEVTAAHSKLWWVFTASLLAAVVLGPAGAITVATSYSSGGRRAVKTYNAETGVYHQTTKASARGYEPVQYGIGVAASGVAVLAAAVATVTAFVWLWWAWSRVPARHGGLSPALAIGLLFVPLFNLYWMFRVVPGLSAALASALEGRDPGRTSRAGYGAGVAACVMSLIPGVNLLAPLALLVWLSSADRAASQLGATGAA